MQRWRLQSILQFLGKCITYDDPHVLASEMNEADRANIFLALAKKFRKAKSHVSFQNFLSRLSYFHQNTAALGQNLLIGLLIYSPFLIPYLIMLFNQVLLATSLCINTLVCVKINQYWTELFVSLSIKTQLHENLYSRYVDLGYFSSCEQIEKTQVQV